MKLLQYNIYFGEHTDISISDRMNNVCKCILEQDADVVCVQEVLCNMYNQIVVALNNVYSHVYPDPRDGLNVKYGTMILSKFPINSATTHKFEFTSMGRDIKLIMTTDAENNKYYICNVHFESEFKSKCMNKKYQYNRCSDILHHLHKKTNIPIFLCTDTNICDITLRAFHDAFNFTKGWRDAWIENGSVKERELTFDSDTNPILIKRYGNNDKLKRTCKVRLDRILHLSNMHITDFKLIGTDNNEILSDHYGILCNVSSLKPESRGEYVSPDISCVLKKPTTQYKSGPHSGPYSGPHSGPYSGPQKSLFTNRCVKKPTNDNIII